MRLCTIEKKGKLCTHNCFIDLNEQTGKTIVSLDFFFIDIKILSQKSITRKRLNLRTTYNFCTCKKTPRKSDQKNMTNMWDIPVSCTINGRIEAQFQVTTSACSSQSTCSFCNTNEVLTCTLTTGMHILYLYILSRSQWVLEVLHLMQRVLIW